MNIRDLAVTMTPEMLDEAIAIGTRGGLLVQVAAISAGSAQFRKTIDACVNGAKMTKITSSPTKEHHLAKTALIGGIQLGIVLALLASERK